MHPCPRLVTPLSCASARCQMVRCMVASGFMRVTAESSNQRTCCRLERSSARYLSTKHLKCSGKTTANHLPMPVVSCVMGYKVRARKLQFSDRQVQISNRGDYGCSEFQFCPLLSPKWEFSAPNFAFSDEHFQTRTAFFDNFPTAVNAPSLLTDRHLRRCCWRFASARGTRKAVSAEGCLSVCLSVCLRAREQRVQLVVDSQSAVLSCIH